MFGAVRGIGQVFGFGGRFRRTPAALPTVFHITHHKAGSQWVHRILHALAYDRLVLPEVANAQFLGRPVRAGAVYPTVYVTREQFEAVPLPRDWRRFVVIRDLRDTLVSLYFSVRDTHPVIAPKIQTTRVMLSELGEEEGLVRLTNTLLAEIAQVQWSWVAAGEELIKYENLLERDEEILARVLLQHCRLGIDPGRFREVIRANRFEARSGRPPGAEDRTSHERKGVAGDWRNHFTDKVREAFKERFGSLLVATGYERGFDW